MRTFLKMTVVLWVLLSGQAMAQNTGPAEFTQVNEIEIENFKPDEISTQILLGSATVFSDLENQEDPSQEVWPALDDWDQIYLDLINSDLNAELENDFASLYGRLARKATMEDLNVIALVDFEYETFSKESLESGWITKEENRYYNQTPEGKTPYVKKTQRSVGVIAPYRNFKTDNVFLFSPHSYLSNYNSLPENLEINFNDGKGWQDLVPNQEYSVKLNPCVDYTIEIRFDGSDGEEETFGKGKGQRCPPPTGDPEGGDDPSGGPSGSNPSSTSGNGGPIKTDCVYPDQILTIVAEREYEGDKKRFKDNPHYLGPKGKIEMAVFINPTRTEIKRPVILADGFDPTAARNWKGILEEGGKGIGGSAGDALDFFFNGDFDLIVVDFIGGGDYIQKNAYALQEVIHHLNDQPEVDSIVAVIGASMGGLVARFALADLEDRGLEHRVQNLITLDTPNRGANISVGVQAFTTFAANIDDQAIRGKHIFNSPAGHQQLIYVVRRVFPSPSPLTFGKLFCEPKTQPARATFLKQLKERGDFPSSTNNIVIANGPFNADRDPSGHVGPGEKIGRFIANAGTNTHAYPKGVRFGEVVEFSNTLKLFNSIESLSSCGNIDSAPGTTYKLDSSGVYNPYKDFCFVPTLSALNVPTVDYSLNVEDITEPVDPNDASAGRTFLPPYDDTPVDLLFLEYYQQAHARPTENVNLFLKKVLDYQEIKPDPCDLFVKEISGPDKHSFFSVVIEKNGKTQVIGGNQNLAGEYCINKIPGATYTWTYDITVPGLAFESIDLLPNENFAFLEGKVQADVPPAPGTYIRRGMLEICVEVKYCNNKVENRCKTVDLEHEINYEEIAGGRSGKVEEVASFIQLYPNPTKDEFHLYAPGISQGELSISDLQGKQRYQGNITEQATIEVSSFAPGLYFVRVWDKETDQVYIHKLIKE